MKKLLILPFIISFSTHSMTILVKRHEQHQKDAADALRQLQAITPPELMAGRVALLINTQKRQLESTEKEYSEYLKKLEESCLKGLFKGVPPEKNDEICRFLASKETQLLALRLCDKKAESANTFSTWRMIGNRISPFKNAIERLNTGIFYCTQERRTLGFRKEAGKGKLRKIKRVNKKRQTLKEHVKTLKKRKHQEIMRFLAES